MAAARSPDRAQAAAVVQAQQGVLKRHRHLCRDQVAPGERRLGPGRKPAGRGQVAPAASNGQGR